MEISPALEGTQPTKSIIPSHLNQSLKLMKVKMNPKKSKFPNPIREVGFGITLRTLLMGTGSHLPVVHGGGQVCKAQLAKDQSGSTKNIHGHLLQLLKKTKQISHMDLKKWMESGLLNPMVSLGM
ncbi:uncharacterized protein VP01_3078g3 [Puccinia sorghi]|uniref:Uncharacterized protein n=1 Tax=Puccinia sorghi TaxID=27349 RepID=A0A0L6V1J0_9BASI|nr:uncharacterized protein VP01_3078g3 [Puccinia sorghi]